MYKIKMNYVVKQYFIGIISILFGILVVFKIISDFLLTFELENLTVMKFWIEIFDDNFVENILSILVGLILIYCGKYHIINVAKIQKEEYIHLAKYGKLIKNHPFYWKEKYARWLSGSKRTYKSYFIAVDFILDDGSQITLYDKKSYRTIPRNKQEGTIDLLIDPQNLKNYYMDFNIHEM